MVFNINQSMLLLFLTEQLHLLEDHFMWFDIHNMFESTIFKFTHDYFIFNNN